MNNGGLCGRHVAEEMVQMFVCMTEGILSSVVTTLMDEGPKPCVWEISSSSLSSSALR